MKMGSVIVEKEKKVLTMTEYIEREAAIRFLLNDSPEQVNYSREDAADCIRYMNAADVAPVVRCRDCKYGDYDSKIDDAMVCIRTNDGYWRHGDDFCSYGRKKNVD